MRVLAAHYLSRFSNNNSRVICKSMLPRQLMIIQSNQIASAIKVNCYVTTGSFHLKKLKSPEIRSNHPFRGFCALETKVTESRLKKIHWEVFAWNNRTAWERWWIHQIFIWWSGRSFYKKSNCVHLPSNYLRSKWSQRNLRDHRVHMHTRNLTSA